LPVDIVVMAIAMEPAAKGDSTTQVVEGVSMVVGGIGWRVWGVAVIIALVGGLVGVGVRVVGRLWVGVVVVMGIGLVGRW
jgi:hypothetical protein